MAARQTLSSWARGKTKIPKAAFVAIVALENEAYQRTQARVEDIARTARTIAEITASREKGNTGTQQEKAGGRSGKPANKFTIVYFQQYKGQSFV